jgi:hypothetical protein
MAKALVFDNVELMREAQMRDEMNMTAAQRIDLVFQLMDLAIALSPNKKIESSHDEKIQWIELYPKDGVS